MLLSHYLSHIKIYKFTKNLQKLSRRRKGSLVDFFEITMKSCSYNKKEIRCEKCGEIYQKKDVFWDQFDSSNTVFYCPHCIENVSCLLFHIDSISTFNFISHLFIRIIQKMSPINSIFIFIN